MISRTGYQGIFADLIERVKELEPQWYSIKPLDTNIPVLADLPEVSKNNLKNLLVEFGLGKLIPDNKLFSFQVYKLDKSNYTFTIQKLCETTRLKVKG